MILQCNEELFDKITEEMMLLDYMPEIITSNEGGYMECGAKGWYFIDFTNLPEDMQMVMWEDWELEHRQDVVTYYLGRIINTGIPNECVGINFRQQGVCSVLMVGYKTYIQFSRDESRELRNAQKEGK